MFKNLKAEMIRQDVTAKQIADTLDIKLDTARLKINGKIPVYSLAFSHRQVIVAASSAASCVGYAATVPA